MQTIKIGDRVLVNKKDKGKVINGYKFDGKPTVYIICLDNNTLIKATAEFLEPIVSEKTITRQQYIDNAEKLVDCYGEHYTGILYQME